MRDKKVVILGCGESGSGAAILAHAQNWEVQVSEFGLIQEKYKQEFASLGISFEEGGHSDKLLDNTDLVIKSPGIAPTTPVMKAVIAAGIPWEDEIEFASRYATGKVAAVTGSNGKTTTTLWLHDMLKRANVSVGLAGNVGASWARQIAQSNKDYWILELSSFQIDGLKTFSPDVAVLCNITPDHLDRYNNSISEYAQSKLSLFKNQKAEQSKVLNADDPLTQTYYKANRFESADFWFSMKTEVNAAYSGATELHIKSHQHTITMSIEELALHGKHNVQNAMAAGVAANLLGIRKEAVRESMQNFQGIPHRMEFVASVHGIEFVNDSKATNVNSTWWALESADKPTIWIVGGVDKGNDYSELIPLAAEKVKAIICLGKDNEKIKNTFSGIIPTLLETTSAAQAVATAYQLGQKGYSVLLSPACASFDLFENFEDRGDQFKAAVRAL